MKEKERQAQAVHQEECCPQHSHPDKRDVTEIEIQGGERIGESFPCMDGYEKPYCRDDLKKESIRLTMGVLRAWGDLGITNVTSICSARCK